MEFDINNALTYPRRQVHLDFHTQPDLKNVGAHFRKEQFQSALREGNVSSITVFARCYHGLCYYPTDVGLRHPGLSFDLTRAMVDAAHEIGVRAPVYVNAGLGLEEAQQHPEWIARTKSGQISTDSYVSAEPELRWPNMCLNDGSYCAHLYAILEEICARFEQLDGLFLDICFKGKPCYCDECRRGMRALGLDPELDADAAAYYQRKHIDFMKKAGQILHKRHPNATIFFNSGGADIMAPEYHPYETHYEIEDLPTVWGGYDKMPLNATFFGGTGKFYLGMTGKFHLEWGEFGGFKCKEALKYEAATMAVYGAGCSVGDHLLYTGEMDMQTYKNIGYAYRYLERIEPYCYGGVSTATIGVWLSESMDDNIGLSMILLESQIDFEVIRDCGFSRFDTVIFPGGAILNEKELESLQAYLQHGGKVLFVGDSLIKDGEFQIDCGLTAPKAAPFGGDYIDAEPLGAEELPQSPFYSYHSAMQVACTDAECLARVLAPYTAKPYGPLGKRTNLPYDKDAVRGVCAVKKGNVVYLAHKIPLIYKTYGSLFHKRYFLELLFRLKPVLRLRAGVGAQGRCRMIRQEQEHRYCINLTYAAPVRRGEAEIIEDIQPLYQVPVTVHVPEPILAVRLPLQNQSLPFSYAEQECRFTLPVLNCHETVVLEYAATGKGREK